MTSHDWVNDRHITGEQGHLLVVLISTRRWGVPPSPFSRSFDKARRVIPSSFLYIIILYIIIYKIYLIMFIYKPVRYCECGYWMCVIGISYFISKFEQLTLVVFVQRHVLLDIKHTLSQRHMGAHILRVMEGSWRYRCSLF